VFLVETALIGATAMAGGAESNPLSGYGWIGAKAVIIADQARDIRQDGLGRRFAGQGV
jgi:hypothetical protein